MGNREKMIDLFHFIDEGGTGRISFEEFEKHLNTSVASAFMSTLQIDPEDTKMLFDTLDTTNTGDLSFDEFYNGCRKMGGTAKNIDMATATSRINTILSRIDELEDHLRYLRRGSSLT